MFPNLYAAELQEASYLGIFQRLSALSNRDIVYLGQVLNVRQTLNARGSGSAFSNLIPNSPASVYLENAINSCMNAVDQTLNANITRILGVVLSPEDARRLMQVYQSLGDSFTQVGRTLGNVVALGYSFVNQVIQAIETGIVSAVSGIVQAVVETLNDAVNEAVESAFSELGLGNESLLGPIVNEFADLAELVNSYVEQLTDEINSVLRDLQEEINGISESIVEELGGSVLGSCADRPDSQNRLAEAFRSAINFR